MGQCCPVTPFTRWPLHPHRQVIAAKSRSGEAEVAIRRAAIAVHSGLANSASALHLLDHAEAALAGLAAADSGIATLCAGSVQRYAPISPCYAHSCHMHLMRAKKIH